MRKRLAIRSALVAILISALPCRLAAQQHDYTRLNVQRGAELSLFAGATTDAPAFGWSAGWRVSPRVALEGSGAWVDDASVECFAALFSARVYLRTTRRAAPFLSAGAGLFHASVDSSDSRTPDFYLDRTIPGSPEKAFNDFVAAGGGGLDVHIRGRIWIRPDARLLVVVDGWRANVLMLAGFHITYSFGGTTGSP
jgi:hypothetical protein